MILSVANASSPRNIESDKIQGLYPEGIRESSSTLISFIERYYEHINTVGLPSYEISNITADKDIDIASDKYLTNIQSLIAKTIPNTSSLDKVTLYKIVLQYYTSRGSEDSIFAFFKLFYDEVVSIFYPRDYIFDLSNGSGQWGTVNLDNISTCLTNPNKVTMVVSSMSPIGPGGLLTVYLEYIGNNVWSYKGMDPTLYDIPFIERYETLYNDYTAAATGWIFTYGSLQNVTSVDATWPDEATWGSLQDALTYDEKTMEYVDLSESRSFLYDHGFTIHSESVDALSHGEAIYDISAPQLYTAISLNPTVWVVNNNPNMWTYDNRKSFASHNYKLHDGHYWQKYSYEIKSENSSDVWINDYLRFTHPAGLKLFSSILLQLFAKSEWYNLIDYETVKESIDFTAACKPPTIGYHTPTYQPGWLSFGPKTYALLATALVDANADPALVRMVLLTLGLLTESSNNRNSIVRSDYQTWSKNIDSTQLCAAYSNMTIAQALETFSNTNACKFSNLSSYITISMEETPYFLSKTSIIPIGDIFYSSKYTPALIGIGDDSVLSGNYDISEIRHMSTLSDLVLNDATLQPRFSTGNSTYTASVSNLVASIIVTPTSTDLDDTVEVNGTVVISGMPSDSISLSVGPNVITVSVISPDVSITTVTYTITVTRLP